MARLSTAYVLVLITVGAVVVLGLAVFLLETGEPQPSEDPSAIVALPSEGPSKPELEGVQGPTTGRSLPPTPVKPQPTVRRGPLQVIARVFDRATGDAIPAFQVTILPHAQGNPLERLDEGVPQPFHRREGIFRIQKKPGLYDLVVTAPGFLPGTLSSVEIPALSGTAIELPLDRGPGIAGTVHADDGLPRKGVEVYLEVLSLRDPTSERPLIKKSLTGLDGRFSFSPLPAGDYAVCLLWPDNREDRVAGIRVRQGTIEVPMRLLARHRVTFRVTNNQGQPLGEARLEVRGEGHIESASTNEAGIASVDNLPDGDYRISVQQPGYHELVDELRLEGGLGHTIRYLRLLSEAEG
jgi:hypothetical protein